ncbi:MAG: right-handed parallel beta-helix repeat-containing protein [Lentisphaeria bacterium]|nr:right-handed parallel beta-helix repeat-containing protein [Lentisphaeria bacterium]
MKRLLTWFFCLGAAAVFAAGAAPRKVSEWGFDENDATECLQKAIDSGEKKLVVDNVGKDWIIRPVFLRSGVELIFADGVTVRALPGAFKDKKDCLFALYGVTDVTLRGEGKAVLKMNKKDYQDPSRYARSEWRHAISLRGAERIKIQNLTLRSSGGDGIYVGSGKKLPGCRDIVLDSVICEDHHRQGISVISAENLLAKNCKFNTTRGTPPQCGIDFEPNNGREWLINNVFENCEFCDNASRGVDIAIFNLKPSSKPVSIVMRNCLISGNSNGIAGRTNRGKGCVRGTIRFEKCRVTGNRADAVRISEQVKDGVKIIFTDCVFDNRKGKGRILSLYNITSPECSGISFENVTAYSRESRPVYFTGSPGSGIADLSGTMTVIGKDGSKSKFNFAKFVAAHRPDPAASAFKSEIPPLTKLVPVKTGKTALKRVKTCIRGNFRFLQYLPAAGEYEIRFRPRPTRKNAVVSIPVSVMDSQETNVDNFTVSGKEYVYKFRTHGPCLRVFDIAAGRHAVFVISPYTGQAFCANAPVHIFHGAGHQFSFLVPAGVEEVPVLLATDPGEPADFQLVANGKIMADEKNVDGGRAIRVKRPDPSVEEVWTLKVPRLREDAEFRIGSPLIPLVSFHPDQLLRKK